MKALILFSSRDGQTRDISFFIANQLKEERKCDVLSIQSVDDVNWSLYDCVLIGASIRYGHFQPAVEKFIKKHLGDLQQRVSGFFSVNLSARKLEKRTPQTNTYTRKFLLKSPWKPDCCAVFAGALRYPRYGLLDRITIQLIMRMTKGHTNTKKEVEYTDWQQVERFTREFAALLGRLP